MSEQPFVEFFSLYPGMRPPTVASRDLGGTMPVRASRACSPFTEASGFGYHLYPPADFAVRWTGATSEWSLLEDNEPVAWQSLAGGFTGKLPVSASLLEAARGQGVDGLDVFDKYDGLPFIEADPRRPEMLEVIPGILARTPPGWRLLVRGVPNESERGLFEVLEGVLETDWYRAYLPAMLHLLQPGAVVRFTKRRPLMAAQPIPAEAIERARAAPDFYAGIAEIPADAWDEFVDWRRLKQNPDSAAQYIRRQKQERRRQREEV